MAAAPAATALPPLALYVHFPWCVRKCPYCDFNSHALRQDAVPEREYLAALLADLDQDLADHPQAVREVGSIFMGGGTPSLFSPAALAELLAAVRARLPLAADLEVTLEANPGTVEHARFVGYREAGITRVSLGVQSFDDAALRVLGRIHGGDEARRAADEVQRAGFATFNLDLMCALPDQSAALAIADVATAVALGAPHVSHYELTLEPNTLFHAQPPAGLPDADRAAEVQAAAHGPLLAAGFERYEVSAWARPGQRCRHNLNYWRFGDYLGIGAGAHGKLSAPDDGTGMRIVRTTKHKQPARYLASAASAARNLAVEPIDPAARPFEFMLNALRLAEGFEEGLFEARTGLPAACVAPACARLAAHGLLEQRGTGWAATPFGFERLNDLLLEFMPA
jgi:oxygen-independent coproporphyrinogen-3 oxidase